MGNARFKQKPGHFGKKNLLTRANCHRNILLQSAPPRLSLTPFASPSGFYQISEKPNAPATTRIMLFSAMPIHMNSGDFRRKCLTAMLAAATLAGGGSLPAAELEAVLLSGNGAPGIPGFPNMNGVYRMDVNNRGDWVARVSRSNGDVVLKNREILVDNNTPEVTFNSIYSMSINNHGDAVSIVYRKDAKVGEFSNGNQVYLNERVLATPGQVMAAPTLPPGTVYRSIYDAVINDLNQGLTALPRPRR